MNIPAFCIKRPAFTIVISLVMVIIGMIGFVNLPVRWIPNVSPPEISISTTYPGANAQVVERDITKLIEESLSGVNGIESIMSSSHQGYSDIYITFKLGQDMNTAVEDVRSNIERIRDSLPRDARTPVVVKADTNTMPILFLTFYDSKKNSREMSDYVDKYVLPSFETLDGVGSVVMYGKNISAMRISLDPSRMAAANVTVDEILQLVQEQNTSIPSGEIKSVDRNYSVVTDTFLKTPEQFNQLIIRDDDNQVIRIRDVGHAQIESEDEDNSFRIDGKSAVALGIIPQTNANPLDVEKAVQQSFARLKANLPTGMQAAVAYNQADYIKASIHSVYESFIEAVVFVWLVILLFLCSFRATLIPVITIPVCLISTFAILYFLGFSINTITLMACVLAIGLVVDDAIVMLENINRHIENGMTPMDAALKGSKEIVFPIIAMTLTLVAVYAPIAFTPGLLGVLFREFTFTLAGAVFISGIVALTLSPMMCAKILTTGKGAGKYKLWFDKQLLKLQNHYRSLLQLALCKRLWVVGFLLAVTVAGSVLYHYLPRELAPSEDMDRLYVYVSGPKSASYQYTNNYVKQLESLYNANPDIKSYLTSVGSYSSSHAFQLLDIQPKSKRKLSLEQLVATLTKQTASITGVRVNVAIPPPALAEFLDADEGDNIGMVIMTTSDYRKLNFSVEAMLKDILKDPRFSHASNKMKWDTEQFQLSINRDRAADLKVPIQTISNTISTLLAGRTVGKLDDANIIIQLNKSALSDPDIFQKLYVRNLSGNVLPLGHLVSVKEMSAPMVFRRYERLRSDTIDITPAPGFKMNDAINELRSVAKNNLPDDMRYTFTGEAKSFLESNGKTIVTFGLALIFIYLVLVAQFESFIDPLVILLTVPFAIIGALLTLKMFGGSLNIYSNIGLITLIGLISKHGILITEFANRQRLEGKSIHDAVLESAMLRLRPILMTTAAMVLGALPLALAFGPGAESRQQIGLVIAGGLLFGTIFSLIVVPIAYTYFAPFRKG